jgi:hypothetical protein
MESNNQETFMRITNADIYKKLCDIEEHVKVTNGKVKLNRWIATTALSLFVVSIGFTIRLLI